MAVQELDTRSPNWFFESQAHISQTKGVSRRLRCLHKSDQVTVRKYGIFHLKFVSR